MINKKQQSNLIGGAYGRDGVYYDYLKDFYDTTENMKSYQSYLEVGNKVWYTGDSAVIHAFFKKIVAKIKGYMPLQNGFWKNVQGDVSIVHLPIASSITETMSNILFGRMPQIKADTESKRDNKKIDSKMESIFDFNNLASQLQQASQLESYSGTIGGKIFIDEDFSYPILQWYPAEKIEEHSKFGKMYEVVFKDTIIEKDKQYLLKTICGYGYIRYELWDDKSVIPLNSIPQTQKIKDMFFVDENGEPIQQLMCVFKQNRVANNIFNTKKGDSDYTGLWNIFDSIDETASAMVDNIKKSRTYTFIPQRMLAKDEYGNVGVNKAYGIDVWDIYGTDKENDKLPQRDYVPISVEPYLNAIRSLTKLALNRVGLSPSTFGLDDAGANASAEALNIRDTRTEKTFKDKSQLWKPTLEEMAKLLLIFDYIQANKEMRGDEIVVPSKVANTKFNATFPPYREVAPQDKFSKWVEMIDNGAMSVEYAMNDALGGEIPDADIDAIKNQLGLQTSEEEVIEPTVGEEE